MLRRLAAFLLICTMLFSASLQAAEKTKKTKSCGRYFPSDDLTAWHCVRLKKGQTLESLFDGKWQEVARFNRIDRRHVYPGARIKVPKDLQSINNYTPLPELYPPADEYPKFILVMLSEQFLGAYEHGKLVFSAPVATGMDKYDTPHGHFRITAYDPDHYSSKYFIEKTKILYPMHWALRFFIDRQGNSFWMHGRDIPGYPASHGCIGLYDEEMQKKYYGYPADPQLEDARTLYKWAIGNATDDGKFHNLADGPEVFIADKIQFEKNR